MFMIVPLAIISGVIIAKIFKSEDFSWKKFRWPIGLAIILTIILVAINFYLTPSCPYIPKQNGSREYGPLGF